MKKNEKFLPLCLRGLVLCIFFPVLHVSAFSVRDIVTADEYKQLLENGKIEHISFMEEGSTLSLNPDTPLSNKVPTSWPEDVDAPNFLAEELYLAKKEDFGRPGLATIEYAGKVLRSFSTLQGIQYYSHSKGRKTTLYDEAYTVKPERDPLSGKVTKIGEARTPDDTAGSADGKVVYALMDDSSLGRTVYRVEYEVRADEIRATFVNESALRLGPIKAFGPGKLRMNFVVSDCGDCFIAYLTTESSVPPLAILDKMIKQSFTSRLNAVYNWFVELL